MKVFMWINLLLRNIFATFHKFWYLIFPFLFVSEFLIFYLLNLFIYLFFGSIGCLEVFCLISTYMTFPMLLLLLICCFILLWWEKNILDFFNVLGMLILLLRSNIWSILENVPCMLKNNICSVAMEWTVVYISVKYFWFILLIKSAISLLIFLWG